MKLATYRDGSRDGQLVVVSRDLTTAHYATGMAGTMQQLLDDWNFIAPQLQDLYVTLNHGKARHAFPFEPGMCKAPLPRPFSWAGGSVLGAQDDILVRDESWGVDFEGQWAVVTGEVPLGASVEQTLEGVRLWLLANVVRLRNRAPESAGCGGYDATWPATAFSPVAVTLDELGDAWNRGQVDLTLQTTLKGRPLGLLQAAATASPLGAMLAQRCQTQHMQAGTVICSGSLGSLDGGGDKGHASLGAKRAFEAKQAGKSLTDYLKFGDTVRIDLKGRDGLSLCGAIEQRVSLAD